MSNQAARLLGYAIAFLGGSIILGMSGIANRNREFLLLIGTWILIVSSILLLIQACLMQKPGPD